MKGWPLDQRDSQDALTNQHLALYIGEFDRNFIVQSSRQMNCPYFRFWKNFKIVSFPHDRYSFPFKFNSNSQFVSSGWESIFPPEYCWYLGFLINHLLINFLIPSRDSLSLRTGILGNRTQWLGLKLQKIYWKLTTKSDVSKFKYIPF